MPDLVCAAHALETMAMLLEIKSIASVTRQFRRDLLELVNAGLASGYPITSDMRGLVNDAVYNCYIEGLKESGIPESEMDDEDTNNIDALTSEQLGFVSGFAADVLAAYRDGGKEEKNAIRSRVDLWEASVAAAGQAAINSTKANEMVTWRVGDTEHCTTCARLDGQKHRRKWFDARGYYPRRPGTDALECGGFNCQCSLE